MDRRFSMFLRGTFLVTVGWMLSSAVTAQAQDVERTPSVGHLLERLEAAELRIQQLEVAPRAPMFPAHFQGNVEGSVQDRLSGLERAREQAAEAETKKKADAASKPSLKINGRIHLDYWNFADDSPGIGFFEHSDATADNFGADPEDRTFFRRIRLKFEGDLFDTMLYRM